MNERINSALYPASNTENSSVMNATSTQSSGPNDPYKIQQNGNAFSYANPVAAAQARANGIAESQVPGLNVRPANDPKGVTNFMANTQEMGPNEQQVQNALKV